MHVVIDLGEMHTYLACWERGKSLEDACIKVKLPGMAKFKSNYANVSWEHDNLREYFSYLYREYLMPSRIIIESASLATPYIFDLQIRRTLLDILEEIFGLYEASIVPRPIAVISGLQMRSAFSPISGDVLLIEKQESNYNFAFISIVETIGITLEKQGSGKIADVLAEAKQNDYYCSEGWHLDHIVLAQNHTPDPGLDAFMASLPPDLNVILDQDLQFAAAEGLAARYNHSTTIALPSFNIIYPYEFYLVIDRSASLERIPFDTANLELECSGRYNMISFNDAAIDNLTDDKNQVRLCIYEIKTTDKLYAHEPLRLLHPVLEINSPRDDLPPYFELGLNMATANIQLDLIPEVFEETPNSSEVLGQHLRANQNKLYQVLSGNMQNEALLRDWRTSLLSPHEDAPALYHQIDQTLFHLYGLLKLWQNQ